jgi:UDP-N-acetylglucosamine 2-epimerase
MDEAGAALDALHPSVAVTYAEAGGWGRALVLEARRRGITSVGVQHGFIYRHWLNYLHEPDEMTPAGGAGGAPIPDVTLLFDRYAAEHLETQGHFPAGALAVTGNARLDAMSQRVASLTAAEREAARAAAGGQPGRPLAVLAAKFTEIRDLLPAFVRAVAAEPTVRVAIKPHPAETPEVYAPFVRGIDSMTVLPTAMELAPLVACADAVITMNSTVAIDALAIGVPALVVGVPNNLSPFVDAGVMVGADATEASMREGVRRVLYDQDTRRQLRARAEVFLDRYGMRPSGRAAERASDVILAEIGRAHVDAPHRAESL